MSKKSRKKDEKENWDFKYSQKKGYPNVPSEYDLKKLIPEDREFLLSQLSDVDSPDWSEEDNEIKRQIIPTFRLRKSIEVFNKKTSFYSVVLIILTIVIIIMTAVLILR